MQVFSIVNKNIIDYTSTHKNTVTSRPRTPLTAMIDMQAPDKLALDEGSVCCKTPPRIDYLKCKKNFHS